MEAARRSREHALVLALCLAAPLVLLVLGRALRPDPRGWGTHEQLGFQPCYPMAHWNVPCPGCGVTTSLAWIARGELLAALEVQPLGPLLALGTVASAVWALKGHLGGRDTARELERLPWRRLVRAAGVVVVLAWLYKAAAARGWF